MEERRNLKLSVIIPAKDRSANTKRIIEELLRQNQPNTEIIVIENNSTEDMSFLDSYPIIVRHIKSKGVSGARNLGLDIATGDYICWVDNDDFISNDYLQTIHSYIQSGYDWYVWQWYIDGNHNPLYGLDIKNPLKLTWALWSYCFKRELFENKRFDLDKLTGGDLLIFDIITPDTKGFYIQKPLYYFRWGNNEDSLSHRHGRGEI